MAKRKSQTVTDLENLLEKIQKGKIGLEQIRQEILISDNELQTAATRKLSRSCNFLKEEQKKYEVRVKICKVLEAQIKVSSKRTSRRDALKMLHRFYDQLTEIGFKQFQALGFSMNSHTRLPFSRDDYKETLSKIKTENGKFIPSKEAREASLVSILANNAYNSARASSDPFTIAQAELEKSYSDTALSQARAKDIAEAKRASRKQVARSRPRSGADTSQALVNSIQRFTAAVKAAATKVTHCPSRAKR